MVMPTTITLPPGAALIVVAPYLKSNNIPCFKIHITSQPGNPNLSCGEVPPLPARAHPHLAHYHDYGRKIACTEFVLLKCFIEIEKNNMFRKRQACGYERIVGRGCVNGMFGVMDT